MILLLLSLELKNMNAETQYFLRYFKTLESFSYLKQYFNVSAFNRDVCQINVIK